MDDTTSYRGFTIQMERSGLKYIAKGTHGKHIIESARLGMAAALLNLKDKIDAYHQDVQSSFGDK